MAVKVGKASFSSVGKVKSQGFTYYSSDVLKLTDKGQDLINYLPSYMQQGPVLRNYVEAAAIELQKTVSLQDAVLEQAFASRATWGLDLWEDYLDLPASPSDSLSYRRNAVLSSLAARRRGSEYYFGEAIRSLTGNDIVVSYDSAPYTLNIESRAPILEAVPSAHMVATTTDFGGASLPNLLPDGIASFESGVSLWTAGANSTVQQGSSFSFLGTKSLEITATAGGSFYVASSTTASAISATPGKLYYVKALVRTTAATRNVRLNARFADSGNSVLIGTNAVATAATNTGWTRLSYAVVAPPNTTKFWIEVGSGENAGIAGEKIIVDDLRVHEMNDNLLSANKSSFENNSVNGWVAGTNTTIDIYGSFANSAFGTKVLRATATATGTVTTSSGNNLVNYAAVSPLTDYSVGAALRSSTTTLRSGEIRVTWYTSAGSVIGDSSPLLVNAGSVSGSVVYFYTYGDVTSPKEAAYASVKIIVNSVNAGESIYIDGVYLGKRQGNLVNSTTASAQYQYAHTFLYPSGETTIGSSESDIVTTNKNSVLLTNISLGSADCTGRNIYRRKTSEGATVYRLVATIPDNYTTTYVDDAGDWYASNQDSFDTSTVYQTGVWHTNTDVATSDTLLTTLYTSVGGTAIGLANGSSEIRFSYKLNGVQQTTLAYSVNFSRTIGQMVSYFMSQIPETFWYYDATGRIVIRSKPGAKNAMTNVILYVSGTGETAFNNSNIPRIETIQFAEDVQPFALNALGLITENLIKQIKPAHLHVNLTSLNFRASINAAGDPV